jgi:ABC-type branched-subunit amino acid transport system substrate-binding protein
MLVASACSSTSAKKDVAGDAGAVAPSGVDDTTTSASPGATSSAPGTITRDPAGFTSEEVIAGQKPAPVVEGGGPVHQGRGVTSTTIKIGINHSAPLGPAFQAVGFAGDPAATDERRIAEILIKYINSHGGLNGRKIIPVYNEYDAVGGGTWDSLAAEACQRFVNDEKVFAVISGHVGQTDSLVDCLAKGHTPIIQQNQWPYDHVYFDQYKNYLYQPSRMRPERFVPAWISGLAAGGYFDKGAKLGLARFDAPVFTRIAALIKNELKKIGQKILVEAVLNTPQSVSDFGRMSSEFQAAILRFRQAGVDHVLFDEYAGEMPFFGLTVAENQDYHPRWAFNSTNLTNTQQAQQGDSQLKGAVSVTWLPGQDVADIHDPRMGKGVLGKCYDIVKKGGMVPSRLYSGIFCDSFFFLQRILSTTNNVTPEGMGEASGKLGTSYESPYTWTTKFSPGRTDGASSVRVVKYVLNCVTDPDSGEKRGCFKVLGGNRPAG